MKMKISHQGIDQIQSSRNLERTSKLKVFTVKASNVQINSKSELRHQITVKFK